MGRRLALARLASLALFLLLFGTVSRADTVTGANGANGTTGAACQPGTPGGDGADATSGTPGPYAQSTARGGDGGTGGEGGSCPSGDGGDGGAGGAGGDASAQATGFDASATATGGSGGIAGLGGAGSPGFVMGTPGDGGDGGNAVATATGNRSAYVTVWGGSGGSASVPGARGGDGGTATGTASATLAADGTASITVTGGQGGSGFVGAAGGDGASVSLTNAASATGTRVTVQQVVTGGRGGYSALPDLAGRAGSASSVLEQANPIGNLVLDSQAVGGQSSSGSVAAGSAQAAGVGTASGSVSVTVTAKGGTSSGTSQATPGVTGAAATLGPVRGASTGGGAVTVLGSATGGEGGGSSTVAGDGADVVLVDAVDGETTGSLKLTQEAIGGRGGSVQYPFTGSAGAGGDARSVLDCTRNASLLTLETLATGGTSGTNGTEAAPVQGGSAEVDVRGRNESGDLVVLYRAIGGEGSGVAFGDTATGGRGGDASANVRAVTTGNGNSIKIAPSEYGPPYQNSYGAFGGGGGGFYEGEGGAGGTGTAIVEGIAEGDSEVDVLAVAGGGVGGNGDSTDGVAGAGGAGSATASGRNAGTSAVRVTAQAVGGDGGYYGVTGGDGGTANASAHGESTGGGNVTATAQATGGAGTHGGADGSVVLRDAVSGATTGVLRLVQTARGGGQPYSIDGQGGDASSALAWTDSDGGRLELDVSAIAGGAGGYLGGGSALTEARGIGMADVNVRAIAQGNASSSLGPVFGQSLGGGLVHIEGELTGFQGPLGEHGVDAVVEDAVDGATGGALELVQRAIGGMSGETAPDGTPARGGSATSRLARSVTTSHLQARVEAIGGAGYEQSTDSRQGLRLPSRGGDALAESSITNDGGAASAFVYAEGGSGGGAYQAIVGGRGGDANVQARASSLGDGHEVVVGGSGPFGAFGGEGKPSSVTGAPGVRGAGGDATSASVGTAAGNSRVTVHDRATGGLGGSGGSAVSHAEGHNQGNERVSVLAEAIGGNGVAIGGAGGQATATARGTSTTGDVDVTAVQTSGTTGGGVGLASDANDAVSGATAGRLTLVQRAIAGPGGSAPTGIPGGAGGAASSSLEATNEGGGALVLVSEALGGTGALERGTGGTAVASARGIGAGASAVDVTARASGGRGGSTESTYIAPGGDGGAAQLGEVFGSSDQGGSVRVRGEVIGGNSGLYAGHGADAVLVNAVTGATTGALVLEQSAIAGTGVIAGLATSSLEFSTSSLSLELHSTSRGGGVLPSASVIPPEPGGTATSIARAENLTGLAAAYALAEGFVHPGYPIWEQPRDGGDGGRAIAEAFARSEGDGHDVIVGALPSATDARVSGAYGAEGRGQYEYSDGVAGNGGAATSASEGEAQGDSAVRVFDYAVGGAGGTSGGYRVGTGGLGGAATSSATGRNAGVSAVTVRAEAVGGLGGSGGATGGDGGVANATATGSSSSGLVEVTAIQRGGAGGLNYTNAPNDVRAGNGADSVMRDAVSGATAGQLSLVQRAVGGDGGIGHQGGAGGFASSQLIAVNAAGGAIAALAEAIGGNGGAGTYGFDSPSVAGLAGDAEAAVTVEALGAAPASATARAIGGAGGGSYGAGADGGAATLGPVYARSESGAVVVTGEAAGGSGGIGNSGSRDGASVLLDNAVHGETSGSLTLVQRASGGNAGGIDTFGTIVGSAGRAGSAVSRIDQVAQAQHFSVTSSAFGGDSGYRATTGFLDAASAESTVSAVNQSGALDVIGRAEGGDVRGSSVAGDGGDANVSVVARTAGDGQDIRVGQSFASDPRLSLMGAIGGAGGITSGGHGGGGDASSSSSAIAQGNSSVEVFDLAIGGPATQGFDQLVGGDASSLASAISAGSSRVLANSLAIGGFAYAGSGDASSRAHAEGLGEVQSSAQARVSWPSLFGPPPSNFATADARGVGASGLVSATAVSSAGVTAQGFASAGVLSDANASARAGGWHALDLCSARERGRCRGGRIAGQHAGQLLGLRRACSRR